MVVDALQPVLYEDRYAGIRFRCCDDRLDEIEPLRPMGGLAFDHTAIRHLSHTSTLFQGDSMAEQHFLSILCLAWRYEVPVDLQLHRKTGGTTWNAVIGSNKSLVQNMTTSYLRYDIPEVNIVTNYTDHEFVVLGGWHHGKLHQLDSFLTQVADMRAHKATIVVETLPNHFPGGFYKRTNIYPPALPRNGTDGVCDQSNLQSDPPDINGQLHEKVAVFNQSMHIIPAQYLYTDRGDAHVGITGNRSAVGFHGRDCLHFCFAPGVLDALALQTLAVMATIPLS